MQRRDTLRAVPLESLRTYAVRIGLKGGRSIKGGKEALLDALLPHEQSLGLDHELVQDYSYLLGPKSEPEPEPEPKLAISDFDFSTDDANLAKFLDGIPTWPQKILQAELEYTLKYDVPLPGWSDLDLLRYTMRFYPHRRQGLLRHDRLTREIRNQLRRDPVDRVRYAAIGSDWQVTQ
jgi:hypothetical protein